MALDTIYLTLSLKHLLNVQHNLQIRGSIISNLFSHLSIVLFYMLSLQSSHKEVISMKRMIVWFTTSYAISASRH